MKIIILIAALTVILVTACNSKNDPNSNPNDCQNLQIKAEIRKGRDCNKRKDIECFMFSFDSLFILESNDPADSNRVIVRDTIKKDILRSWSIITNMYEVEQWIDSIQVPAPDTAIVFTDQYYHRTFSKPRGLPGEDDVVSTQRHKETWIRRATGWKQQKVKELGGSIYVNGKPYKP